MDGVGAAEFGHFLDPSNEVFVGGWRSLDGGRLVVENGLLHIFYGSPALPVSYRLQKLWLE
jgi:hypothetical protein